MLKIRTTIEIVDNGSAVNVNELATSLANQLATSCPSHNKQEPDIVLKGVFNPGDSRRISLFKMLADSVLQIHEFIHCNCGTHANCCCDAGDTLEFSRLTSLEESTRAYLEAVFSSHAEQSYIIH